eukprot:9472473-Pyramimonas_sp.AAC.2
MAGDSHTWPARNDKQRWLSDGDARAEGDPCAPNKRARHGCQGVAYHCKARHSTTLSIVELQTIGNLHVA